MLVEGALLRPVLHLGLGHRGAEVDVPHGGGLDVVDVALLVEVEEAQLGEAAARVADRRVLEAPVHGEAQALPEGLEGLLVLRGEGQAQVDEVAARDLAGRGLPRLVVGHGRRAARARRARRARSARGSSSGRAAPWAGRCRPSPWVEDVPAPHPLVAREDVGLGVAEDVAHVQRARDRGRRGVDDEGLRPRPPSSKR